MISDFNHSDYQRNVQYALREITLARFRGDSVLEAYAASERLWRSLGMTGDFAAVRKLFPLKAK
jgi:hypothetical protein